MKSSIPLRMPSTRLALAFSILLMIPARAESLSANGSIGKVVDTQGITAVKPVMHSRWTLASEGMLLEPGDWLRTDVRGANAIQVRLAGQASLILGPATMVELVEPGRLRLVRGELEVSVPQGKAVQLVGAGDQATPVEGTQVFRSKEGQITRLEKEPNWLQGFKGTITTESLGSLLANVEGRNVPLTVGYHKVTIDIRDQIARTVIEESFVNHTDVQLEGVFYFPLPQDASISGFGMWIGDQLVEADVVEKERAREIYETILRERRDPGLLEWSGGNIFKARVFPIFARSEKRIKITYTQVLPLKGGRCRYSYALQSELLRQHPLRELAIDVRVHSALPLERVACPTHETRVDRTEHSAHVEFAAQEYTPDRDFEVEIQINHRQSPVALIPHQRGEDGYFLLLLTPPDAAGDWQRQVMPDGEPLEILILADTSASMDAAQREVQDQFIAALLGSLGEKDTFTLATCDVECRWLAPKFLPVTEKNIAAARDLLAGRHSLGWTDLDKAFASVLELASPRTNTIYIGDGIVTTGDADPVAFGKRLKRLYEGKSGAFHALATGSSFEPGVLKAIASLGGGSFRRIQGETGPAVIAQQLLSELAQPSLRDLKIEFKGFRAARIYPEELPNIAPGSQQIALGRYLPEGRDLAGEVIVTGMQEGKEVQFRCPVSFKHGEEGNSFIPRLWARLHLDALLEQGASTEIKEEIIALSEEYQIMTPYTSFLVLESDQDRDRFKVKRRFRMRDGEKFFAEGRDSANFELMQKQMKRAGNWRIGLRRSVLEELAQLGRDLNLLPAPVSPGRGGRFNLSWGAGGSVGGGVWKGDNRHMIHAYSANTGSSSIAAEYAEAEVDRLKDDNGTLTTYVTDTVTDQESLQKLTEGQPAPELSSPPPASMPAASEAPLAEEEASQMAYDMPAEADAISSEKEDSFGREERAANKLKQEAAGWDDAPAKKSLGRAYRKPKRPLIGQKQQGQVHDRRDVMSRLIAADELGGWGPSGQESYYYHGGGVYWLQTLFPYLPPAPQPAKQPAVEPEWPAPAKVLADSLLRREKLAALAGGLEISAQSESYETRRGQIFSISRSMGLISSKEWLTRADGDTAQTLIQWCDAQERGVFSPLFQLGRYRKSEPADLTDYALPMSDNSMQSIEQTYRSYRPTIEEKGEGQVLLRLNHPNSPDNETQVLIDTRRHVIVRVEHISKGKISSSYLYSEFVEVAGCWWATRVETRDAEGKRINLQTLQVTSLAAEALSKRILAELEGRKDSILLAEPLPTVLEAKQAVADGKANLEAHLTMLLHFAESQQWERAGEHLAQMEKFAAPKPGIRWVQNAVLHMSRRHEELKQRLIDTARERAGKPGMDELFLANYLLGQSSGVLQAHEMLAWLDTLKPLYERQPAHTLPMKTWNQQRVSYLEQSGQPDAAFALKEELAKQHTLDTSIQQQYIWALYYRGDYETAYAWMDQLLSNGGPWLPYEEESIRGQYTQFLENEGRLQDLVNYLETWLERKPQSTTPYAQYISALVRTDQEKKAEELMAIWMKEALQPGPLEPAVRARLEAAVSQSMGQGHNLYTNRMEERWFAPLSEVVRFFARNNEVGYVTDRIMSQWQFQNSDACRALRKEFARVLIDKMAELELVHIQRFIQWIWPNDPAVEKEAWKQMAMGIQERWEAEKNPDLKHQLAEPLARILRHQLGASELLAFLHRQMKEGSERYRMAYTNDLFYTLLEQPWSQEFEDEAFGLLSKLSDDKDDPVRLGVLVHGLYQLDDWCVRARQAALMAAVEHQEKLSRTELKALQRETLQKARENLAARLAQEAARQDASLATWLTIERLYFEVTLGRDPKAIAAACLERVGAEPPKSQPLPNWLDALLLERHLETLEYLASRPKADPGLITRLLAYFDMGIAADPDNQAWKEHKYRLLLALDRPDEMEQAFKAWIRPGKADNTWRLALAYLHAERNRLSEAIQLFEAIQATDELGPEEYRTLADWYLVANQKEKHEEALVSQLMTEEENRLSQRLYQQLYPWQRGEDAMPQELDPQVIRIFTALFRKSQYPSNYLWQLQQFYQHSRDFRLLKCLAEGVIGHSAAQIYPFIQQMSGVLGEIRDEATADSVIELLGQVRERAKTAVDQRGLDLLESQVERRAAEVLNQPGPHAARALAALQRAFKGEWSPGERRLMADFLGSLGNISQASLAKEQLRQLEILHGEEKEGSYDRLIIASNWGNVLWYQSRWNEALDIIEAALNEFRSASGGILPQSANGVFNTFVSYLQSRGHYAQGEKVLLAELKRPANPQQKHWLIQSLYGLYNAALANGAEVSFGSGLKLYKAVEQNLFEELKTGDQNHRYNMANQLCSFYRTAHDRRLPGVVNDLIAFGWNWLPEILQRQTNNYQNIVSTVAGTIHDLAGPLEGLAFLIKRIENEPAWFRHNNQDGWDQHSWNMGYWRSQSLNIGLLEGRLLKLVTAELRRDLETQQSRSRCMYHQHNSYFWPEKTAVFAGVADEVWAERNNSGAAAKHIADYLYYGLPRVDRAIQILFEAYRRDLLDEGGQSQLVTYLHQQGRYPESIPLLQALMKWRPDNIHYRCNLMRAYFHSNRKAEVLALLQETDAYFHEKNLWHEQVIAELALACLQTQLYERSIVYYKEVIPLHQRAAPNRGIGNGTLSSYYARLSEAYAGLGLTAEAVEAAGGAIVSWGKRIEQRRHALEALQNVLRQSPNLDGYVAFLDGQVQETGLENPIVRKALGQVYLGKGDYGRAVDQLRLALTAQPNDAETHQALVESFERQGDIEGVVQQLLDSVELSRRDMNLYKNLGRRYGELGRLEESERAYTSIAEMLPQESESHALLAEIRQEQGRWPEAIIQWQQVARIRSIEPEGYLKLAAAQIHMKGWAAAKETVQTLLGKAWPSRFGDVHVQARALMEQIERGGN